MIEFDIIPGISIVVHEVGPLGAREIVGDEFTGRLQDENRKPYNPARPEDDTGASEAWKQHWRL